MVHPLKYHNITKGVAHPFAFDMILKAMLLFVLKDVDGEVSGDMRFSVKCMGIGSLRQYNKTYVCTYICLKPYRKRINMYQLAFCLAGYVVVSVNHKCTLFSK